MLQPFPPVGWGPCPWQGQCGWGQSGTAGPISAAAGGGAPAPGRSLSSFPKATLGTDHPRDTTSEPCTAPRAGLSLVVFRKSGSCALNNLNLMRKRGVDQEEEEAAARGHGGFPGNRAVRAHAQASIITLSSQAAPGEVSSSRGALEGAPPTPGGHWEPLRGGSEGHLPPPTLHPPGCRLW